jgi:hypothetical protein
VNANEPRKEPLSGGPWRIALFLGKDGLGQAEGVRARPDDFTEFLAAFLARQDTTQALKICIIRIGISSRWSKWVIGGDQMTKLPAEWTP